MKLLTPIPTVHDKLPFHNTNTCNERTLKQTSSFKKLKHLALSVQKKKNNKSKHIFDDVV